MKYFILFFVMLSILTGCKEDKVVNNGSLDRFDKEKYLTEADEMPQPKGGIEAVLKNIVYPEAAKNKGIEGKVFVKAFIDEEGKVVDVEVIKGADSLLNSAAKNAIIKTAFTPALKNNKAVKFQAVIPVVFKLNGNSNKSSSKENGEYYSTLDEMPRPIGGIEAIAGKIVYPQKEKNNKTEGKVLLRALIDENGKVIETEIVEGATEGLNNAAINALKDIKFVPGKIKGESVKSQVTIPITFKLN